MDHELYRYRALQKWPLAHVGLGRGHAPGPHPGETTPHALRAFVVLFLEHWEAEPPSGHIRDPRFVGEYGSFTPDYRSWTQREYGLRVGIFRVMDALREAGIRPVVAANALAVQRVPGLVARLQLSSHLCLWIWWWTIRCRWITLAPQQRWSKIWTLNSSGTVNATSY